MAREMSPRRPKSPDRFDTAGDVAVAERTTVRHPKMFKVFLINDNFTTMDFVVAVLERIFRKSPSESVQIMLKVHKMGKGLAGVYTQQIAEAKIEQVHSSAKEAGHPLKCTMEEE